MNCANPACNRPLTPLQRRKHNRCCCLTCAALMRPSRTHRNAPPRALSATETSPSAAQDSGIGAADLTPQNGSCGSVLWTEGRTVYTVGTLNGVAVVMEGRRVYCTMAAWPNSPAGRRSRMPKARPVVLFETWPAYGRSYPVEVSE